MLNLNTQIGKLQKLLVHSMAAATLQTSLRANKKALRRSVEAKLREVPASNIHDQCDARSSF
jgi:hypothetical protein